MSEVKYKRRFDLYLGKYKEIGANIAEMDYQITVFNDIKTLLNLNVAETKAPSAMR